MNDFFEFMFSGFWTFVGCLILISIALRIAFFISVIVIAFIVGLLQYLKGE